MPELPEVETTRRGLAPYVVGRSIAAVEVREPRLRWPVPKTLSRELAGQRIDARRHAARASRHVRQPAISSEPPRARPAGPRRSGARGRRLSALQRPAALRQLAAHDRARL